MQQNALKQIGQLTSQTIAIKANDETVLKSLYESNYHSVEKYVLKNSGCIDQAKDIYQEAFIAVWRNIQLDKFHPESESSLSAYLYQIARNKWIDYLRSKSFKSNRPIDDVVHKLAVENRDDDEEDNFINDVKKHFQKLSDNCKEVLTRFYYKNQSMRKIAKHFGWTEATARNNKYRCLQRLRELIKEESK